MPADETLSVATPEQFIVHSEWRDNRYVRIRVPKEDRLGDPGFWWLRSLAPHPTGQVAVATAAIADLPRNGKGTHAGLSIADRIVGPTVFSRIACDRARNRKRVQALQDAERRSESQSKTKPQDRYFWPEERNELLDYYQDTINRLVSMTLRAGVSSFIERDDLVQRLRLTLAQALDEYRPVPGVQLDAYVWKLLKWRVATALNEENDTDGITFKPQGAGRAFQLNPEVWDTPPNGKRGNTHDPDTDKRYGEVKKVFLGPCRPGYAVNAHCNSEGIPFTKKPPRTKSGMISWKHLGERELRKIAKLDVRGAIESLGTEERKVLELWQRGFTQEEIAIHLRTSQSTVSRLLSEAIEKLRSRLAAYGSLFASESMGSEPYENSSE